MELKLCDNTRLVFDPNDLVQVILNPNGSCQYMLKGMPQGTLGHIGNIDGTWVFRKLNKVIEDRSKKRNTLSAYAAALEN